MIKRVDGQTDLSDTVVTIIYCTREAMMINGVYQDKQVATKMIYHHGDFDDRITLDDILKQYSTAEMVISESGLHGEIYRYGNHGDYWEQIGTTGGYA